MRNLIFDGVLEIPIGMARETGLHHPEHDRYGGLERLEVRQIFRGRRLRIIVLEFCKRGLEPALIGGAAVPVRTHVRHGRQEIVYLRRAPAAPIATEAGAEQKDVFHQAGKFALFLGQVE